MKTKRIFDLLIAVIAIILLSPLLVFFSLILALTGENEVFFRQKRIGQNSKEFNVLKFATMLKNSSLMGAGNITQKNDSRVLPLGKLLRKYKINELPQLWNILTGEMSIVGPRPLTSDIRSYLTAESLVIISNMKPGLTGMGSICFRDEESLIAASGSDYHDFYKKNIGPYKSKLEVWYAANQTIFLDIKIIIITVIVVIFPKFDFFKILPKSVPKKPENIK
jgi:lipopolysaccharide/colanic/teichoic acid biosynthesis glycosyltransferase